MKSRLFWKIFLPFWILQTGIMLYLAYQVHVSFGPEHPWWVQPERRALPVLARAAAWRYGRAGQEGLRELLRNIALENRSTYWLFDAQRNELSGQPLPPQSLAGIQRALQNGNFASTRRGHYLVERFNDRDGHPWIFAGEFLRPPLLQRLPGTLPWIIVVTSLLTSLLCAGLAQYLTQPILRLRDAASAIAGGNLEARAGIKGSKRSDEITDLVRDFDFMANEIRELVESNRRMLMSVSHDLRSPISRSRVALSLASSGNEEERREMLQRVDVELLRLNGMIERILTVSRLESGAYRPHSVPLSLNQIIGEAVEDARFEATQLNVEVFGTPEDWPSLELTGEPNLLRSAFENVLRNAIFYSGQNGRVEVSLEFSAGTARVAVRDNGPGVPPDKLAKIFEAFYRVDDARVSSTGGTGLGLSIVTGAVKFHKGRVSARNLQPHGLEILIELSAELASTLEETNS